MDRWRKPAFRGAINPENIDNAIEEYKGAASFTVQSAFRYDYKLPMVKSAIKKINKKLPENLNSYRKITKKEAEQIKKFNVEAKKIYQQTVEQIAPVINNIAAQIPGHRERVQHVGISGYFRGMGKVNSHERLNLPARFTVSAYRQSLSAWAEHFSLRRKPICLTWFRSYILIFAAISNTLGTTLTAKT